MHPQLVFDRMDKIAKAIVPAADKLAKELSREWPSGVYAKIRRIINDHVTVASAMQ